MSTEWNATSYHAVSAPQTSWGEIVLSRLELAGDERVIDVGCGSGRLTAPLLDRLPRGHVLALDRSRNMLEVARTNLRPTYGARVSFVQAALPHVPVAGWADVVFSTATFHWVRDHETLFRELRTALRPGGRLHAQCGGGPNLAQAHALAEAVMHAEPFARYFADWNGVWEFASAETTRQRLIAAGFADVVTEIVPAPTTLATEADYRAFVTTVIYHPHLARLTEALRPAFLDAVVEKAAATSPAFTLDYWRLNMAAATPRV